MIKRRVVTGPVTEEELRSWLDDYSDMLELCAKIERGPLGVHAKLRAERVRGHLATGRVKP